MLKKLIEALKPARRRYVYKSAITGRYVSEAYAKAFPEQTYRERI